jgi:hypothetical protein
MAGNSDNALVHNEPVGDSRASFRRALIVLSDELKPETLKFPSIRNGYLGTLGNVNAEIGTATCHRPAHADLDCGIWLDYSTSEFVSAAHFGHVATCASR